ncbi:MAG: hypothetical protein K2G21_02485, partial [Muribaculaceae bacterium]|nr:hypothetical protein [Muribaculaceae bacterium]
VYTIGPDKYVFIGREPNGGHQYAMTVDLTTSKIDTVRQINISPELQSWMPNMGEMAYSGKRNRLAFAYKLHPIIEVFGLDGSIIETVRVGGDTFDDSTLEMADFDSHNQLQFIDLCATPEFLYALHGAPSSSQTIYQIDWNGNIISRFVSDNNLKKIAIHNDTTIIGYSDSGFVTLRLSKP